MSAVWGLLGAGAAAAQTVTGILHGRVVDPAGAAIPGVSVTAVNVETGLLRSVITDDMGNYQFEALLPGVYRISAELAGFKRFENPRVQLSVGQRLRVDVRLEIGELSESVTVSAGGLMVDTRSGEISSLVDDRRITDLPLSGRNVIALAALLPGVSVVRAPQVQTGSRSGPRLSVHGGRENQNFFTLNGTYFNNPSRNTGLNPPPPDAVREFRIKTNNFSAAEGRNSGSVVSVVTRGGTNEFHGAVWEFHRNDNLNARSFFQTSKPERIQNQFGVAAGGPIVRDRIFFFGSYEGFRDRPQPSQTSAFTPTAAERAGDFSDRKRQLVDPFTGQPFPDNRVPTSLFDPVAVRLLNEFLPLPNAPDGRRFVTNNPNPNNNELVLLRNDFQLSERQNFFWHYYYNANETPNRLQGNIPGYGEFSTDSKVHNFGLSHSYTFSPTLINQLTFGFTRTEEINDPAADRSFDSLGMNFPNYHDQGSPQFSVSGRFSLLSNNGFINDSDNYTFSESMSWTRGNHTFRYGAEYFRLSFLQQWLTPPSFNFTGALSGDSLLDFLLGAPRNVSVRFGRSGTDTIQPWYWSFYFQDEWKMHPRFTLTLGMRYELPSPWNEKRDLRLSSIVVPIPQCERVPLESCGAGRTSADLPAAPPGYLFANFDLPRGLVEVDKNNFAPRLGFAWDVKGDGRMSVRGGFGLFYDTSNADTLAQVNPPFSSTRLLIGGKLSAPHGGFDPSDLPPADLEPDPRLGIFSFPLSALSTDLTLRNTYFYHWNLGIQRQLNPDLAVSIDYVGKIGRKMLAFWPFNPAVFIPGTDASGRPRSSLANIDDRVRYGPGVYGAFYNLMLSSMFDAWYHGMDVQVNRRLANGFSVLVSYTLSKAIDQNSTFTLGGDSPNPFDPKRSEQGLAAFDRRHVFSLSALWTPVSPGTWQGLAGQLLGGWTFSPMIRLVSGAPLEFFNGEDRALDGVGTGSQQHPNALRNPKKTHDSNLSKIGEFFDTGAFQLPAIGTYGNASKGLIAGPGFRTFDLGILKDFPLSGFLSEESRVQFRTEFFNLFNNTNFNNPTTVLTSPRFGQITGAGDGREVQFGLKLIW